MENLTIYFICFFMIHIANIATNGFIIYALRKLGKLGNISFWFIYCLSISDCFVGLSGLAFETYFLCCYIGNNCFAYRCIWEMREFFLSYSFRLTTVIAIDRSIRMKYLNRYQDVMTKRKAYIVLILSALLGLAQAYGNLSSQRMMFKLVFMIFHFICITFSCILYTFTYCSIKQQVRDLNSNLRCNDSAPIHKKSVQLNVRDQSSNPDNKVSTKEVIETCNPPRYDTYHASTDVKTPGNFQNIQNEEHDLSALGNASSENSKQLKGIQEKLIESFKGLKNLSVAMVDHDADTHGAVLPNKTIHIKVETNASNLSDVTHRDRTDNDIGKAMLLITFALILFYFPMFIEGTLLFCGINSGSFGIIALAFFTINSSNNAIILTIFSRGIRNVAKSLFRKY